MPSIYFYTLNSGRYSSSEDLLKVVCRLTEKAVSHAHRVYILTKSAAQAERLDELLWQFKSTSFIPHIITSTSQEQTEDVGIGETLPPTNFNGMLINLSSHTIDSIDQYARVNEIVGPDDESLSQGRERYRSYRSAGVEIVTNKI